MSNERVKICSAGMCSKPAKQRDKWCSMHRARFTRHGRLDKETYIAKIFNKSKAMPSGCIEWQGYTNKMGYGRRRFNGTKQLVHRMVYVLTHEGTAIPFGLIVCHKCDNPPCINPAHLFLGTHADNIHDCINKGRKKVVCGEQHWATRLVRKQAEHIKKSPLSATILAKKYDVLKDVVWCIKGGRTWKHI